MMGRSPLPGPFPEGGSFLLGYNDAANQRAALNLNPIVLPSPVEADSLSQRATEAWPGGKDRDAA